MYYFYAFRQNDKTVRYLLQTARCCLEKKEKNGVRVGRYITNRRGARPINSK